MKAVEKDSSYKTEEERLKAYSKLSCDPSGCPLNIRHPPNGFEFGIGCGMCKPKEPEAVDEMELLRRQEAKERAERKAKHDLAIRTLNSQGLPSRAWLANTEPTSRLSLTPFSVAHMSCYACVDLHVYVSAMIVCVNR